MEQIYYAYTFREGFNLTFNMGPKGECTPDAIHEFGIPFIKKAKEKKIKRIKGKLVQVCDYSAIPALGELSKHSTAISELTFSEILSFREHCLNQEGLHKGKKPAIVAKEIRETLEEILQNSPFERDVAGNIFPKDSFPEQFFTM